MMTNDITTKVIGVAGFARSGKDTFVKVATNILLNNGYSVTKLAFADDLKNDIDDWLKDKYGISAWTNNLEEKNLIRPFLVAHGCGKRTQTQGKYWVDKINRRIELSIQSPIKNHVFFVSDVRFPNEAKWVHESWNGWLVHLKKYILSDLHAFDGSSYFGTKLYDFAPNEEEAKNDPLVEGQADFKLELENVIEKEKRNGNIITVDSLVDSSYLIDEITKCLHHCPFLTLAKP